MPITKATASSIAPAAKGDLVVGSATNDASVLAVGTNDHVLTADSSTSTGLKWAAPAAPAYTYATWVPTYSGFTAGNATVVARYVTIGNLISFYVKITLGSTSSLAGNPMTITLPETAATDQNLLYAGCLLRDTGSATYIGGALLDTTTTIQIRAANASGTYLSNADVSSTVPFTWANTDIIQVTATYEKA